MTEPSMIDDIETLLAEFARSGAMTLHVRSGDFEILLSNDPGAGGIQMGASADTKTVVSPPPPPPLSAALPRSKVSPVATVDSLPADSIIVHAPNLGTFYRAPKPGAANYVEIGSIVAVGDELCLIEVMKLFTSVRAERAGRVHAMLAEDGAMVEAGQPLFALVAA